MKYYINDIRVKCLYKGYLLVLSTNCSARAAYQSPFHRQRLS